MCLACVLGAFEVSVLIVNLLCCNYCSVEGENVTEGNNTGRGGRE